MKYCIFCNEAPIKVKKAMLCGRCYQSLKSPRTTPLGKETSPSLQATPVVGGCHRCDIEPIFNVKHGLCRKCYYHESYSKNLYKYSRNYESLITIWKEKLAKKYGSEIHTSLKALKTNPFLTLNDVGNVYGITRERVRQIYQKYYNEPYSIILADKIDQKKTDLSCKKDPRNKVVTYPKTSHLYKGALAEKTFLDECIKRGYRVNPMCDASIDLMVNGWSVDVKTAYKTVTTKIGGPPFWHFGVTKKQLLNSDFIVCFHFINMTYFIIPATSVINGRTAESISDNGSALYINAVKSSYRSAKNRYWEYENAWNLLENARYL